jgi:hypothetical protein
MLRFNVLKAWKWGLVVLLAAVLSPNVQAQGTALVNVAGGVESDACASIVADTTGHIGAGMDGPVQLTGAEPADGSGGRKIPPPHLGLSKGFEGYPLQRLYNQLPTNAKALEDQRSQALLKEISEVYNKLQTRFSRLRIDVVTIPAKGKTGLDIDSSRAYAEAIAKALAANGVQYVHVDGKSLGKPAGIKRTS